MPTLTGQQVYALALERLAGGSPAKLVRLLRLREVRDVEHLADQVSKWARGEGSEPRFDVILPALDALGAINWEALQDPPANGRPANGKTAPGAPAKGHPGPIEV